MARVEKQVTIRFFELILSPSTERARGRDWNTTLDSIRSSGGLAPIPYGGGQIDGYIFGEGDHVALSLAIDRAMAARQRNLASNERKSMRTDGAGWQPAEESFAVFFENNVFGILRTSSAAPSHAAVATWITRFAPPRVRDQPGSRWVATPVVDEAMWEELRTSGRRINSVDFALRPEGAPRLPQTMIGGFVREIAGGFNEGVKVEVSISAGRQRGADHNRELLEHEVRELMEHDLAEVSLEKAQLKVQPVGGGAQEPIDLLHQRIAKSVKIPVPLGDADGVELAAVAAAEIRSVYSEYRDEINGLVGPVN